MNDRRVARVLLLVLALASLGGCTSAPVAYRTTVDPGHAFAGPAGVVVRFEPDEIFSGARSRLELDDKAFIAEAEAGARGAGFAVAGAGGVADYVLVFRRAVRTEEFDALRPVTSWTHHHHHHGRDDHHGPDYVTTYVPVRERRAVGHVWLSAIPAGAAEDDPGAPIGALAVWQGVASFLAADDRPLADHVAALLERWGR